MLLAAATLAFAPVAAAGEPAPRTSSLAWVRHPGAEPCIDARALAQAVERRLGRSAIVAPTAGDIAIEGRVERRETPPSWHVTITVFDGAGARIGLRELTSERADCRAIDDELGLIVSLLIDPDAGLTPAAPPPRAPLPPPPPPPPAPAPVCPPAAVPAKPAKPWRVAAEAGVLVGLGVLPRMPGVGVIFRGRAVPPVGPSFELGGAVWIQSPVDNGGQPAAFSLAQGSIALCPFDLAAAGNTLSICAGARIGSLRVGGEGLPSAYRKELLVVDLTAEVRARRRIVGPLLLGLGIGLAVPTRRDRFFYVDGAGTERDVFQASPVAGLFDFALGLEIP